MSLIMWQITVLQREQPSPSSKTLKYLTTAHYDKMLPSWLHIICFLCRCCTLQLCVPGSKTVVEWSLWLSQSCSIENNPSTFTSFLISLLSWFCRSCSRHGCSSKVSCFFHLFADKAEHEITSKNHIPCNKCFVFMLNGGLRGKLQKPGKK